MIQGQVEEGSPLLVIDWTCRRREGLAMDKGASVLQPIKKVETLPLASSDTDKKTWVWEDIARICGFPSKYQPVDVSNDMAQCIAPYCYCGRH